MRELILIFVTSFFVVLLTTPSLIKVAELKHLFDEPGDERKLHKKSIPTIGGILIFAGTLFSFSLWYPGYTSKMLQYVTACGLLLFFVGVKDDIIGTSAVKKLLAHIIVGLILVLMAEVRITSLHGVFGVRELPEWGSISISLFSYIVIVNAFNLVDGLDGLATGVGFLATAFFTLWFFLAGDVIMAALAISLGGALLAFLIFNFSPARIFMGDSGSLTIGLFLSILAIRMVEYRVSDLEGLMLQISRPILALAIIVYPLVDTLRIFLYRTVRGMSPFTADKNHIHHRLLALGLNQKQTVLIIYGYTVFIVGLTVVMKDVPPTISFLVIGGVALVLTQIPFVITRYRGWRNPALK